MLFAEGVEHGRCGLCYGYGEEHHRTVRYEFARLFVAEKQIAQALSEWEIYDKKQASYHDCKEHWRGHLRADGVHIAFGAEFGYVGHEYHAQRADEGYGRHNKWQRHSRNSAILRRRFGKRITRFDKHFGKYERRQRGNERRDYASGGERNGFERQIFESARLAEPSAAYEIEHGEYRYARKVGYRHSKRNAFSAAQARNKSHSENDGKGYLDDFVNEFGGRKRQEVFAPPKPTAKGHI